MTMTSLRALLPFDVEERDLRAIAVAVAIFLAAYLVISLVRRHVIMRLRLAAAKTPDPRLKHLYDHILAQLSGPEPPLLAFFLATRQLEWTPWAHRALDIAVVVLVGYRLIRIAQDTAAIIVRRIALGGEPAARSETAIESVTLITDVVLWVVGGLLILSNLGVNVNALLAGLGIGGVAAALAGQSILADFFAAVVIFLDRPFVVGDLVALDKDWQGVVERTGFKTTRLRAPTGEAIVVPNSQLTNNKLRNLGRPAK